MLPGYVLAEEYDSGLILVGKSDTCVICWYWKNIIVACILVEKQGLGTIRDWNPYICTRPPHKALHKAPCAEGNSLVGNSFYKI